MKAELSRSREQMKKYSRLTNANTLPRIFKTLLVRSDRDRSNIRRNFASIAITYHIQISGLIFKQILDNR